MASMSKPCPPRPELEKLLRESKAWFDALTPEEQEAHLRKQRESWVRGEIGMGSDADEAAYRAAMSEQEPAEPSDA